MHIQMEKTEYIVSPDLIARDEPQRAFGGPSAIELKSGEILAIDMHHIPSLNYGCVDYDTPPPVTFRSSDRGKSFTDTGPADLPWDLPGPQIIAYGGSSLLRLQDGRIAWLFHRDEPTFSNNFHYAGRPGISFSQDEGQTWTPARLIGQEEGPYYVMNDRLIQMRSGRLVVPVARGMGWRECDVDESLCFYTDDGSESWALSRLPVRNPNGPRGMAEPCVVELADGRLMILARTGIGVICKAYSSDGGDTWSAAEPTTLIAPLSSLTLRRIPDGRLFVLYNHARPSYAGSLQPRTPLTYATSADEGETWSPPIIVDDQGMADNSRAVIYPSICCLDEGILILYHVMANPAVPVLTFDLISALH